MSAVSTLTSSVPAATTSHPNCRKTGSVRDAPAGISTPSTGIADKPGVGIGDELGIGTAPCVGIGTAELEMDPSGAAGVEITNGTARWPERSVNSNPSRPAMTSEPAPIVMMIRTPKVEPPGQRRLGTSSGVAIAGSAVIMAGTGLVGAVGLGLSRSPHPTITPIAEKSRTGTYFGKGVGI
jgi:hypothetical protein